MPSTTVNNWKTFESKMFQDIGNEEQKPNAIGVLASQVEDVQAAYVKPAGFAHVLKSIFSLGIYNLVNYIKEQHQAGTLQTLKDGIDQVHNAMSFITAKRGQIMTSEEFITHPLQKFSLLNEDEPLPKGLTLCTGEQTDPDFPNQKFLRCRMGDCNIDFSLDMDCFIRIANGKGERELFHLCTRPWFFKKLNR